jgi:BolA protein
MTTTIEKLKQSLQQLEPTELVINDDSALHVGHTTHNGGGHYTVIITSDRFEGLSLLQRHRLVFDTVDDLMKKDIHALSIKAHTASETA